MHPENKFLRKSNMALKQSTSFANSKSLYDPVVFSFMFIGIDIFDKNNKSYQRFRFVMGLCYYCISIIALITIAIQLGFLLDGISQDLLSTILFSFSGMLLRFTLHRKRKDFIQLVDILTDFRIGLEGGCTLKAITRNFYFLCTLSMALLLILLLVLLTYSFTKGSLTMFVSECPLWGQILKNIHPNTGTMYEISFIFILYVCCYLPFCVFNFFYALLSLHLREILSQTNKAIMRSPFTFKSNHHLYSKVRWLVDFTDEKMKYVVLIAVVDYSMITYFTLFNTLQKEFEYEIYRISAILVLILVFLTVAYAVLIAGEIPVINKQILSTINDLPMEEQLLCQRISLIHQVEQDLSLSVAGVIPLTKSWVLALSGTILTYSLLIRTFQ